MNDFVRGAKVRRFPILAEVLTITEAALVMCEVAQGNGIKTAEEFGRYMAQAWEFYCLGADSAGGGK